MNVLLIGGGGREHALAYALYHSNSLDKLFCFPGNPGIFQYAEYADIELKAVETVINFCKSNSISLVVVGPEQPLADGLSDILNHAGIKVFGPSKLASRLESSKTFAKRFMQRHSIPTAGFASFSKEERDLARDYLKNAKLPVVLKADGLAAGKGVVVAETHQEALETIDAIFGGIFKSAGDSIVVEEYLEGEEASILAVSDGKDFITLASSQDHKRIFDGDKGKNTGGMGAYAPAPIITSGLRLKIEHLIIKPTIEGAINEGFPFVGCLYAGLMIKNGEPFVIEFNVRFGDPETQAVLPLFKGDFAGLLYSAAIGKLDSSKVENIQSGASCCVVLASEGYPDKYDSHFEISGIAEAEEQGALVFHAGTKAEMEHLFSAGGRVLAVTAIDENIESAVAKAYKYVEIIDFQNKYYRNDIGKKGIDKLRKRQANDN